MRDFFKTLVHVFTLCLRNYELSQEQGISQKEYEKISIKKQESSSHLIYNIFRLGKMAGEAEPFSARQFEDELPVKCLENLAIKEICGSFE